MTKTTMIQTRLVASRRSGACRFLLSLIVFASFAAGCFAFLISAAAVRGSIVTMQSMTSVGAGQDEPNVGVRRALIICGHPGDDDHRKQFAGTVESLRKSLIDRLQFDSASVWVLFGGEEAADDAPRPALMRGPSTQESITSSVAALKEAVQPADTLWVLVIGHSHFDGRNSWFNIPGPDLNAQSFGRLFEGLACGEQVFWVTMCSSSSYIKSLSAPGRVIITATEDDRELNETTFPHVLAELLANPPETDEFDADKDGALSVFDLYITLTRRIAATYAAQMQLSTEHALLDDNADARGTEVQLDYLSEELGGRNKDGSVPQRTDSSDGQRSSQITLPLQDPS
jgi:hypothetical protein